jgi:hypothetical protein
LRSTILGPAFVFQEFIVHPWLQYALTFPERLMRAAFAGAGGAVHETAQLLLPRLVRRSRIYEVTAKNALRIAIELVGGVEREAPLGEEVAPAAGRIATQKLAGNVVELGSVAAFGFSPLWLLAGAADILNGTRVYLRALESELVAAGALGVGTRFDTVDQLIAAIEGTAGGTATLIDLPPLELSELRRSLEELRADASSLPTPGQLAALFEGLVRTAHAEQRSLLEVSSGVGLAFLTSARNVGRIHLLTPYREDWAPLNREGFGAYATRVSRPYREALTGHFDPHRVTVTERLPGLGRRAFRWAASKVAQRRGRGAESD